MSPDEAARKYEEALSALPPELQETFSQLAANAKPRAHLDRIDEAAIAALAPEDLDIAVIDFIDRRLASSSDRTQSVLMMPRGLQVFYLSFIIEAEVMNGGFNQFFWNSSSEYAELVAPALRELALKRLRRYLNRRWKSQTTRLKPPQGFVVRVLSKRSQTRTSIRSSMSLANASAD